MKLPGRIPVGTVSASLAALVPFAGSILLIVTAPRTWAALNASYDENWLSTVLIVPALFLAILIVQLALNFLIYLGMLTLVGKFEKRHGPLSLYVYVPIGFVFGSAFGFIVLVVSLQFGIRPHFTQIYGPAMGLGTLAAYFARRHHDRKEREIADVFAP